MPCLRPDGHVWQTIRKPVVTEAQTEFIDHFSITTKVSFAAIFLLAYPRVVETTFLPDER